MCHLVPSALLPLLTSAAVCAYGTPGKPVVTLPCAHVFTCPNKDPARPAHSPNAEQLPTGMASTTGRLCAHATRMGYVRKAITASGLSV